MSDLLYSVYRLNDLSCLLLLYQVNLEDGVVCFAHVYYQSDFDKSSPILSGDWLIQNEDIDL